MAGPASPQRLDRVRGIYDAIVAGDVDRVMTDAMDEIEWRNPTEAIEPGTRRGQTEFAEAVNKLFEQFDFEQLEILDSAEHGDVVAVRVRTVATGRTSGAPFDTTMGNVFRFDGDRIIAFEWAPDPDAALRSAGMSRWPGA